MTYMRKAFVLFGCLLSVVPVAAFGQDYAPQAAPSGYVQQGDPNGGPPQDPYAPPPQGMPPQGMAPPGYAPQGQPPQPAPQQSYSPEQIDQLIAPIALYPDQLISQILMASTYPLEIVEAQRWRADPQNAQLNGPALQGALDQLPWDPSVKSLVAEPQVLSMLNNNLQWTEQLGDAFLSSQPGIMDSIQHLRQRAQAAGNLQSTQQQTVVPQDGAIVIQPTNPQMVYVPYYNPTVVYGAWPYAGYPPYYFPPQPGYVQYNDGLIGFGVGLAIIGGLWDWNRWDWHRHEIFVDDRRYEALNRGRAPHFEGNVWAHDPDHRHGVPYHSAAVRQQFQGAANQSRQGYRGYFNNPEARNANTATNIRQGAATNTAARQGFSGNTANTGVHGSVSSVGGPSNRSFGTNTGAENRMENRTETRAVTPQTAAPQTRTAQPEANFGSRAATNQASPQAATRAASPWSGASAQRSSPMFESFSHGTEVRSQAERGSVSRASSPTPQAHAAPEAHAAPQAHAGGGEARGGGGGGGGGGAQHGGGHDH